MDKLKDGERLVFEMFLIIEQSAHGCGAVIDEGDIWRSFMEICNERCGTDFMSPDAARMATNRIRETIPLERLEELYEEATGRELCFEKPHRYERNLRDKSPEDVERARPVESCDQEDQNDDESDLIELLNDAERDGAESFKLQQQLYWDKEKTNRFSKR